MPEMKDSFPKWKVNGNERLVKLCSNFKNCPEAIDLLTQMMQLEPSRRITLKDAMAHPFFKEFNSPNTMVQEVPMMPVLSPQKHKKAMNRKSENKTSENRISMADPFNKVREPLGTMNLNANRISHNGLPGT